MQSDFPVDRSVQPSSDILGEHSLLPSEHLVASEFKPAITLGDPSSSGHPNRIAILIDGASLFYAALQLQVEIDYSKLLRYLTGNRQLLRAYFYTGNERSNERQQGFLLWMRRNGYRVVTKDLVTLPDGTRRANLDVEIAIDMMTLGSYCDTIVLLSGTGDLSYAVNTMSYRGIRMEIVSLRANTNEELINLADQFVDLAEIQDFIRKSNEATTS